MNFRKRSYQPILRYLYTETIKRGGELSLHKHFKRCYQLKTLKRPTFKRNWNQFAVEFPIVFF